VALGSCSSWRLDRLDRLIVRQHERCDHVDMLIDALAAEHIVHAERLQHLDDLMTQQVAINADVKASLAGINTTLARVETLLARLLPQGDNGREA
jgi:hypothetical protein